MTGDTSTPRRINWRAYFWLALATWTLLFIISFTLNRSLYQKEILEMARIQARSAIERDILFRQWNAMREGLYATVTEQQQPNPYLKVPERDVTTESGEQLTLLNPSYMTRQVHELGWEMLGLRGHMTSLQPLRPLNAPDIWEKGRLEELHQGVPEASGIQDYDGHHFMRLIKPLTAQKECLTCHSTQGYAVGDIIGALSVSVPMQPFLDIQKTHLRGMLLWHVLVWFCGIIGMGIGAYRVRDQIHKRRAAQDAVRQQALHDPLTTLPNRRLFFDRLDHALKDAKREHWPVALLYIDLDGFKDVNDTFGHNTGDVLLTQVAEALGHCIREVDTLARLGGDEFCIILTHMESEEDAPLVAQRVVDALSHDWDIDGSTCRIGASVGISIAPTDGETPSTLLKNADEAMYRVKSQGKGGFSRH